MAKEARGDETFQDFGLRARDQNDRSVEPKNHGPTGPAFVKVVGALARDGQVHGTVIKRLRRKKRA